MYIKLRSGKEKDGLIFVTFYVNEPKDNYNMLYVTFKEINFFHV